MSKREGKYGQFYGCTGYPRCRNTRTLRDAEVEETEEDQSRLRSRLERMDDLDTNEGEER
jgi:ssDNA-binding Zn-finger/Zn-ribbon topoisomerase 1